MGAEWDQVRSRGPQFRSESGVDRIIRYLGGGALPAVLETVAVAVHLQDVNVVGEPVKQSAGEPLGAEHVGPLVEGQVGGDQDGAPLVALGEDLEGQFRSGGRQGDKAQLIDGHRYDAPSWFPSQGSYLGFLRGIQESGTEGQRQILPAWEANLRRDEGISANLAEERRRRLKEAEQHRYPQVSWALKSLGRIEVVGPS